MLPFGRPGNWIVIMLLLVSCAPETQEAVGDEIFRSVLFPMLLVLSALGMGK